MSQRAFLAVNDNVQVLTIGGNKESLVMNEQKTVGITFSHCLSICRLLMKLLLLLQLLLFLQSDCALTSISAGGS